MIGGELCRYIGMQIAIRIKRAIVSRYAARYIAPLPPPAISRKSGQATLLPA